MYAATAMLAAAGNQAARAAPVATDTQYNFQNAAGPFSTGFTPTFTTDPNGELNFGGTAAYVATDDLGSASVNNLTFTDTGAVTVTPSAATNILTLVTNSYGVAPSIYVGSGGASIGTVLNGSSGYTVSGGGNLTLTTSASTVTGPINVNASALTLNVGQSGTAAFYLNAGTLLGNQALGGGNLVYAASGTSTFQDQGSSNTFNGLFAGNGNLVYNEASSLNVGNGGVTTSIFGNFGGTVFVGSTVQSGFRLATSSSSGSSTNPFANFDFGALNSGLTSKSGSFTAVLGGVQSTGAGSYLQSGGGGHSSVYIVGAANLTQTYAGLIQNGSASGDEFIKVGTGTLTLTGLDQAAASNYVGYGNTGYANVVHGGTLQLSEAINPTGLLVTTSTLAIGNGGVLAVLGNATTASTETVASTTVGAGGGGLLINPNGGPGATFNMGALLSGIPGSASFLTGAVAGSSIDVTETAATAVVTTTTAPTATGTYGGRIVFTDASGNTNFATSTSTGSPYTLSAYTAYTALNITGGTTTDTNNSQLTAGATLGSTTPGTVTTNSLKVAPTQAGQTLDLGTNTLALTSGGLLFTGAANYTITDGKLASGTATTTPDLIISQYGAGNLTVGAVISNGAATGAGTLTVAGTGTVTLTAANTYTGATFLNGGVTSVSSDANLGAAASGATLNLNAGTLQATATFGLYNGSAGASNRAVSIGGGGGTIDVTGSNTLTVAGVVSNTNGNEFGPLTKTDSGTLVLSGVNTYGGATIINGGVLSTTLLANGNINSGIGSSPSVANALIINGGTLQYTGPTVSTDRTFTIGTSGGGLDASGTGAVTFASLAPVWFASGGSRTITLTGSNIGANTLALPIYDPVTINSAYTGLTSLTKTGPGQWDLSNPNSSYTGTTTVNAGTLRVNNLAGGGAVNVNAGGTLGVAGLSATIPGLVTVASGPTAATAGTIGLAGDGQINTLFLTNAAGLSLGGTSGNASGLTFDLQTTAGVSVADSIALGANPLTVGAGGATLAFSNLGGLAGGQTYTLLNFGSGTYNGAAFTAGTGTSVDGLSISLPLGVSGALNVTGTQVQFVVNSVATAAPATAYFSGSLGTGLSASSTDGSRGNFTTDSAGTTPVGTYPGPTTAVYIAADNATNLPNLTLGQNFDFGSLTFRGTGPAATTAVSITGANTLSIEAGGITLASGNAGATLGMSTLALGQSQAWTNSSANPLNVSANVTSNQTAGTTTLTLANTAAGPTNVSGLITNGTGTNATAIVVNNTGAGTTTFSGNNTFTGGTTVTAGTLTDNSGNGTGLGANVAASNVSIAAAAAVVLNVPAVTTTAYNYSFAGSGLLKFQFSTSTPAAGANAIPGAASLAAFTGTVEVAGAGSTDKLQLTGQTVNAATTLQVDSGTTLYVQAGTTTFNTIKISGTGNAEALGALRLGATLGGNVSLLGSTTIGPNNGTLTGNVSSGVAGLQTLTVGPTGAATGTATLSGVLGDGSGQLALTTVKGTTILTNAANTYTGNTTVTGGTLTLATAASNNNIASSPRIVVNTGGTLNVTGVTGGSGLFTLASSQMLAGGGTVTGPLAVATGSTITGGTGATATDTLGQLTTTGPETWAGGTYAVKLDSTQSVPDTNATPIGASGASPATGKLATDVLILSGLGTTSTGLTVSPVLVTNGTGANGAFTAGATYSFLIAKDSTTAFTNSSTFDGLVLNAPTASSGISVASGYTLASQADGTGQDLLLDFTATAATPEPASLLLVGLAAAPLALGRRRRQAV